MAVSIPAALPAVSPSVSDDGWWRSAVPTRRPDVVDVGVATALALYGFAFLVGDDAPVAAIDVVLLVATCTAMVWRRLAPDLILAMNIALRVLLYVIKGDAAYPTWAMSIALFTFVAARPVWAGIAAWAAVTTLYVFTPYRGGPFEALSLVEIVSPAGFFAAALGGGFVVKRQHQLNVELRAVAAEVAASVAAREQLAVMEERNRLRDDLHDIIGHHITVATVLADTALTAHGHDERRLIASLEGVGSACRTALDEMDRATSWLTTATDVEPTPSLSDRRALVESVRLAGLEVREHVAIGDSELDQIDHVVSATGHRFLQEALTNVLKHSPQRCCAIELAVEHDTTLAITVTSSAATDPADASSTAGSGLRRLRRRLQLLGGTLDAGPAGDRFVQRATIPLRP